MKRHEEIEKEKDLRRDCSDTRRHVLRNALTPVGMFFQLTHIHYFLSLSLHFHSNQTLAVAEAKAAQLHTVFFTDGTKHGLQPHEPDSFY